MVYSTKKILGMLLPSLAFMSACNGGTNKATTEAADSTTAVTITTATAQRIEYTPTLELTGTAEAVRSVNLGTSIPGRVERVHCRRGDRVKEGELLVELSDEMLVQAEVEYNALKQDLGRLQRLHAKGTVSSMDLEHLQARFDAAESKVALLKKNTSITAPFSGTVTRIMVQEGENYSFAPTLTESYKLEGGILQLQQLHPLKVVTSVNERDLAAVAIGATATVRFDAYPHDTLRGHVSYISPELLRTTRSCEIEIEVANSKGKYKPGMYGRVSLACEARQGVFVPLRALMKAQGTGDEYVYTILSDSTAQRKPITRGTLVGAWVEVQGIEAGEVVAVEGKSKLLDGSRINVIRKVDANAAAAPQGGAQ